MGTSGCRSGSPSRTPDSGSARSTLTLQPSNLVNGGRLPFSEPGGNEALAGALGSGLFRASTQPQVVSDAEHVIVVIGTPVDEHLNPDPQAVLEALAELGEYLRPGQLLVLRSTIYPGVTRLVESLVDRLELDVDVAFCPERIAEGKAFEELHSLPQIVSGRSTSAIKRAGQLFSHLTDRIVETTPEEAELAKLFTNTLALHQVRSGQPVLHDRQRLRRRLRAGSRSHHVRLPARGRHARCRLRRRSVPVQGHHAAGGVQQEQLPARARSMMVNEGLPLYLVDRLEQRYDLASMTVGILGMAFKAESDDIRSSPVLQAAPHPAIQGPEGALHRPVRHRGSRRSCRRRRGPRAG